MAFVNAGFTPGPWVRTVCRVEGDGQTICVADLMRRADYEKGAKEAEANARLIAAAPKMHAALTAFEKQWNACGGNSHFGGLFQSVRDAAVEALAEADAEHWTNRAQQVTA